MVAKNKLCICDPATSKVDAQGCGGASIWSPEGEAATTSGYQQYRDERGRAGSPRCIPPGQGSGLGHHRRVHAIAIDVRST